MTARFITSVLVAGAFIAALAAAPADAADRDDLKRFIGAAAGLYILGQAIEHGKVEVHQTDRNRYYGHDKRYRQRDQGHKRYGRKGHREKRWHRAPLPRHCLRRVGGRGQGWHALSGYCLRHNYRAQLPRSCRTHAWYKGRSRPVYSIGCLRSRGYDLARR